jgi:hypothetical protein
MVSQMAEDCNDSVEIEYSSLRRSIMPRSNAPAPRRRIQLASSSGQSDRRRLQPINQQLPSTTKWAANLPATVQLSALLQTLPRIANAIARLWQDDAGLRQYLDELLTDNRGGRRGFPPDVHLELILLREYRNGRYPWESNSV